MIVDTARGSPPMPIGPSSMPGATDSLLMEQPTTHERRVLQLTNDGLIGFNRSAAHLKTTLTPEETIAAPKPMLARSVARGNSPGSTTSFPGTCPAPGFYTIEDCYVGKCGTLLDKDRKVLWAMISSPPIGCGSSAR